MINGLSSVLGAAVLGGAVIFVGHTLTKDRGETPESKTIYEQVLEDSKAGTEGIQLADAGVARDTASSDPVAEAQEKAADNADADWWEEQPGNATSGVDADAAMEAADAAMQQVPVTDDQVDGANWEPAEKTTTAETALETAAEPAADTATAAADPLKGMAQPAATPSNDQPTVGKAVFRNAAVLSKPDSNKFFTQNKRLTDKPDDGEYFTENKRFVSNETPEQLKSPCEHADGTAYTGPGTVDNPFAPENPCLTPTIYAAAVPDSPNLPSAPVRAYPSPELEPLKPFERALSPYRGYSVTPVGLPGPMPTLSSNGGSSYKVQRTG